MNPDLVTLSTYNTLKPKIQRTFRAKSSLGYLQSLFGTWGTRISQKWNPGLDNTRCDGRPVTLAKPAGGDELSLGDMKLRLKKIKQQKNKEANFLQSVMLVIKTSKIAITYAIHSSKCFINIIFVGFGDRALLCRPEWPQTDRNPPASVSQGLGLQL